MLTFIVVVFILFLVPGPAVILTVTQSIRAGKRTGILTGLGIATGDLIHTIASVLGLSAILMTSALAFEVIKYIGAAYLLILGIRAFLQKPKESEEMSNIAAKKNPSVLSFRQAVLIELLNPKTALFFLAFLPQFVKSSGVPVVVQLLMLGLTFVFMSALYTTLLALLTSTVGTKLFQKQGFITRWQNQIVGLVYIGLGLRLAFETQK